MTTQPSLRTIFRGVTTAMVTPFDSDGAIDYASFGNLIEHQISAGINGLLPCGSTGEAATLSHDEHVQVFEFVSKTVNGRVPVMAGTGSNSTQEAIRLSQAAQEAGCDAVLLISPYYNKPSQVGVIAHYEAVADHVDIPVILYDIPGRTGIKLGLDTVLHLAEHPRIQGIKDASGSVDNTSRLRAHLPDDFAIFSGDDSLTLPMLSVGADGVVSVASHILGPQVLEMVHTALDNDFDSARELHLDLLSMFHSLFIEPNPCPVKFCLAKTGLIESDTVRMPLVTVSESTQIMLESLLAQYGAKIQEHA